MSSPLSLLTLLPHPFSPLSPLRLTITVLSLPGQHAQVRRPPGYLKPSDLNGHLSGQQKGSGAKRSNQRTSPTFTLSFPSSPSHYPLQNPLSTTVRSNPVPPTQGSYFPLFLPFLNLLPPPLPHLSQLTLLSHTLKRRLLTSAVLSPIFPIKLHLILPLLFQMYLVCPPSLLSLQTRS